MNAVRIEKVTYSYQKENGENVLKDFCLTVEKGEFLCVIGHSGCGKSTLLHLLAGLEKPQMGTIRLDDCPVTGPGVDRAIVFQHYSLFPWMNVRANIMFAAKQAKHFTKKEISKRTDLFLEKTGMKIHEKKYPYQLSGGMRQRTAIARALAMDAEILLLDEPFSALDTHSRSELQQLIRELWAEDGKRKTVIFVTHDLEEAMMLASRIIFISGGKIAEDIQVSEQINQCCVEIQGQEACQQMKTRLKRLFL